MDYDWTEGGGGGGWRMALLKHKRDILWPFYLYFECCLIAWL